MLISYEVRTLPTDRCEAGADSHFSKEYCDSIAGRSERCHHVDTLMFALINVKSPSWTDMPGKWMAPSQVNSLSSQATMKIYFDKHWRVQVITMSVLDIMLKEVQLLPVFVQQLNNLRGLIRYCCESFRKKCACRMSSSRCKLNRQNPYDRARCIKLRFVTGSFRPMNKKLWEQRSSGFSIYFPCMCIVYKINPAYIVFYSIMIFFIAHGQSWCLNHNIGCWRFEKINGN